MGRTTKIRRNNKLFYLDYLEKNSNLLYNVTVKGEPIWIRKI